MRIARGSIVVIVVCLVLASVASAADVKDSSAVEKVRFEDLTKTNTATPGKVYRMGETGICGTVEKDHIRVTHVIPGSVADSKILKGDRVRGMQHLGMGGWGGIPNLVSVRLYRIGRDDDWHFYVTVERESLRGGKGNTVTYDLRMPPDPGNLCHYGPTGFFAKRYADHLLVDVVEKGSPSDGKLQKGDSIVAVDGKPITIDAYNQFTRAIDNAESEAGKGELKLTVKRDTVADKAHDKDSSPVSAEPLSITLKLKVLGSYSKTAPCKCAKTEALITQTADWLVEKGGLNTTLNADLLGLLATGEDKYIQVVRGQVHTWAKEFQDPNAELKADGYVSWHWGYRNLVLTEYYLLTGDKYVLPAIKAYSLKLAAGQDAAGLWGHRMCHPELGRAYGYGVMNQPSVSIFISLILAQKCGIDDPVLRAAIERTHSHFDNWVGRGALPYGNHAPMEHLFTNNGTSGSLAVALALLGNQKGARFYASLSAASTDEILTGHGGPWWNILWSGLGANVLGPDMAAAYNCKIRWLRTVTRCWDGRYVGIMGWGSEAKPGGLSDTGSHLLNLCAGRRAISITGKGMDKSLWVAAREAGEIVEAGAVDDSSEKSLLVQLGSPLPPVRVRAAQALAMRDANITDEVMKMLVKGNTYQRIGAMHAIQNLKIDGAEDELLAIAKNEKGDAWVRQLAVETLGGREDAKKYAPELLKLLVQDKRYDNYGELDLALGAALVKLYEPDPYATNLDKDMFYQGVAKLLDHKHASGRGAGMALLKNIPMKDLPRMIDKMVYVIEGKDRTYTSYTGAGRQEALEVLYRLGIKESMDYTINTINEPTGRAGPRARERTELLKTFGAEAGYLVPRIREVLGKEADPIIKQIEASKTPRKMITTEEVKKGLQQ